MAQRQKELEEYERLHPKTDNPDNQSNSSDEDRKSRSNTNSWQEAYNSTYSFRRAKRTRPIPIIKPPERTINGYTSRQLVDEIFKQLREQKE